MIAGVAGLQTNSTALASISQNIANVNTVGYKANNVDFEALVTNGASTGTYSAGGVATVNQQFVSQQGATTQTASPTDLAIAGRGHVRHQRRFKRPFASQQTRCCSPARVPSRRTSAGLSWKTPPGLLPDGLGRRISQGNITTSTVKLTSLTPINITALSGQVSQTTAASITGNLNSSQSLSSQLGTLQHGAAAGTSMTGYSAAEQHRREARLQLLQIPVSKFCSARVSTPCRSTNFLKNSSRLLNPTPVVCCEIQDTAKPQH